jgi:hypothetical protein
MVYTIHNYGIHIQTLIQENKIISTAEDSIRKKTIITSRDIIIALEIR